MSLKIPRSLVEFILLGPEDDRRQLQDSPILGDVWVEYAKSPGKPVELLITPDREHAAPVVASQLNEALAHEIEREVDEDKQPTIAYLQGIVAAKLTFEQVLRFVLPMTVWWGDQRETMDKNPTDDVAYLTNEAALHDDLNKTRGEADRWLTDAPPLHEVTVEDFATRRRFSVLSALLLWAADPKTVDDVDKLSPKEQAERIVQRMEEDKEAIVEHLRRVFPAVPPKPAELFVWSISLNRRATPALARSVPAVKADAARTLFRVDCSKIVWAIIDSGIDASHYAFGSPVKKEQGKSRVKRSFDFTDIREIVTIDNLHDGRRNARLERLLTKKKLLNPPKDASGMQQLAGDAKKGHAINWELVEGLVELDPADPMNRPRTNHGTHVAGILAASTDGATAAREAAKTAGKQGSEWEKDVTLPDWANGICPDIVVWDFRVLGPSSKETEFAIIAALQFIRYVNERFSYTTIHGANLSLSIPHDVRNFACGRTPICNECERLVNSGVVVVAAAGNRGYQNFETSEGRYEGYAAFSVTDPGNADGVITVGATHRYWPHTYGVSFFSSRGPTGDGRLKPDLVAPGERIRATLPRNTWGDLDGTSMAAPHVSGAAAMLMARYSELIGEPRRIKKILCDSATDLGRERSFQGYGMLDVLRAFQSI
jgi:hypothetical protein